MDLLNSVLLISFEFLFLFGFFDNLASLLIFSVFPSVFQAYKDPPVYKFPEQL